MKPPFKVRLKSNPSRRPVEKSRVYGKLSGKQVGKLCERAKAISAHLAEVRPLYNELDEITLALLTVKVALEKYGVTIIDKYAEKNTAFKTVAISRYEIKWRR